MDGRIFYVYEHWRPDRGECFYVGKGKGARANMMRPRNRHHLNIQAKLSRLGMCAEVRMVAEAMTEEEAFAVEVERIAFWVSDGAELTNLTAGGEGISGFRHSDKTKTRLAEANKGKPPPFAGKSHTDTSKQRMSELGKMRGPPKLTAETIERIADFHRGRKRSAETCAKISAKALGRPSAQKGKISPLRGRKHSDESIQKMREAAHKTWEKRHEKILSGEWTNPLLGREMSAQSRQKMSESAKNRTRKKRVEA